MTAKNNQKIIDGFLETYESDNLVLNETCQNCRFYKVGYLLCSHPERKELVRRTARIPKNMPINIMSMPHQTCEFFEPAKAVVKNNPEEGAN